MVRQMQCRAATEQMPEMHVAEARAYVRNLVEYERGRCGGDVDVAMFRASALWGVEEGTIRSLWLRCRPVKFVKSHIMDRLRQIDAVLKEANRTRRAELIDTAQRLEAGGNLAAAGLARKAAAMAGE